MSHNGTMLLAGLGNWSQRFRQELVNLRVSRRFSLGCSGLEGVFTGSSGLLDSPLPKEEGGETVDNRFSRLGFRQDVVSRRRREAEPKIGEAISSEQCVQIPTVEFLAFEG